MATTKKRISKETMEEIKEEDKLEKMIKPTKFKSALKLSKPDIVLSFNEPIQINQSGSSSIEMKRNAKGTTEFTVKIYGPDPKESQKIAEGIFEDLNVKFPFTS